MTANEEFEAIGFKLVEPIDTEFGIALYSNGIHMVEINPDEIYFYFAQGTYSELSHNFPYKRIVKLYEISDKLRKELGWNDVR